MVSTRSSGNRLYERDERIGMRMRRARRWTKNYKPSDIAHRHRIADSQPKSVRVVSYTRR